MKPEEFTQHLESIKIEIERFTQEQAPAIVGKVASDFFTDSFQKEGFENNGLKKWQNVKRKLYPKNTPRGQTLAKRPILTGDTANLGRSISYDAGRGQVTVFSDVRYAAAHNKGTATAGRNRNILIPKRQFIGDSKELDKKVEEILTRKLKSLKPK